jgi:hypothetical protein
MERIDEDRLRHQFSARSTGIAICSGKNCNGAQHFHFGHGFLGICRLLEKTFRCSSDCAIAAGGLGYGVMKPTSSRSTAYASYFGRGPALAIAKRV